MKWYLLLTLFACSSHQVAENKKVSEPSATAAAASAATESDAKPVSPLTVQPCYCMKMFMPVCAGGQSYGNSCEAECNGHKTWKEGSCEKKK